MIPWILVKILIDIILLGIINDGGLIWGRIIWIVVTILFMLSVIFRIFLFIQKIYLKYGRSNNSKISQRNKLKFNVNTLYKIFELFLSIDLAFTDIFMIFWLFNNTLYFSGPLLSTINTYEIWIKLYFTTELLNRGTGFGSYIPNHTSTEFFSILSVYISFFYKILIFGYLITQIASRTRVNIGARVRQEERI